MVKKTKTLVIGLDGASFNFVQPWIDQGLLPNFKELVEQGSSGNLESSLPPVTMPAWRVYSTGKNPGKLGIFWHQQLDMKNKLVITPNASMVSSADYWDYLNRAGYRSGVVGMPDLYPPRPVDGFVVCGGPSASVDGFTYPHEWGPKLLNDVEYEISLMGDFYGQSADSQIVTDALNIIEKTFRGAEYLYKRDPVEYLQIVSFDINRIQHFFYDQEPTLRAWQIADKWLGKLSPQFDYVFIMSDHGTELVERAFFLNVWLKQEGYLVTRFKAMDILPRIGINRTMLGRIATFLRLTQYLNFDTVRKYSNLLPSATGVFGEFGNQAVLNRTDWSKTKVIALAQGPIYINRELLSDEDEYLAFRTELVGKLEEMTEPISGKKVFKKVYLRDEIYTGPFAEFSPDLVALNNDEYHNRAGLNQPSVFADSWAWKGNNRHQGMFIASGPGIQVGYKAAGAKIIDLAPTILHVNGVPVADDMDGTVLEQIFLPDSKLINSVKFQTPIYFEGESVGSEEFDQMVAERLKKLGYIE